MRTKYFLFIPFVVLALALSACGVPAGTQAQAQPLRNLSVTGTGTVYLTPDIANIYIGVHNEDPVITTAVNANNAQTQALVNALKDAGIAEADIQTSNFSVYSTNNNGYDKFGNLTPTTNYAVDNTVYVTIRDLTRMGAILSTALNAGANNINSITFDVSDKTAAMAEARQKAMDNAASLADELAQTAGVNLGEIETISYTDNSYYPYYSGMGGGASAPNASVPIQPGKTQISVSVSVTYGLK
jgi:uncharacterized protein YggE